MNMKAIIRNVVRIQGTGLASAEGVNDNRPVSTSSPANPSGRVIIVPLLSMPIVFIYDEKTRTFKLA